MSTKTLTSSQDFSNSSSFNPSGKLYKVNFKVIKKYQYDIRLHLRRDHLIDKNLQVNGLRRGTATSDLNNCLLHSIHQQLPQKVKGVFQEFVNFVRERIGKTNGEQLSINDEEEGTQVLSATQAYLSQKTGSNYHFILSVSFADNDGEIAPVDVSGIQQALNSPGEAIKIRIIIVNYNHYEPLYELHDDEIPELENLDLNKESSQTPSGSHPSSLIRTLPSYIVNIPVKVDSDEEEEDSSDEEIDGSFSLKDFEDPSCLFRLLPASEKSGKRIKKNSKRGKVGPLLNPSVEKSPVCKSRLAPLLDNFVGEAARIDSSCSPNRLGVSLGFNKMRSLSSIRNRSLGRTLNEKIATKFPVRRVAFFWDGIWQKYNGNKWVPTTYEEARRFYKQLKRSDLNKAKEFRKQTEAHRGHMVPYREVRDALKNSSATKELIQHFRNERKKSDAYMVFLDSDLQAFRLKKPDPGMFAVLDENYLKSQFEIGSTGYTIMEPGRPFLELSVAADLTVRDATARFIPRGVYYPEPSAAIKIPNNCDTIPENFSDPGDSDYESPKEMPRIIDRVIARRGIDPQKYMVFDARGAVITACPKRMEREFSAQQSQKNGFILWGLSDFKTMRGISQTHYNPRDWALNLIPALNAKTQVVVDGYALADKKVIHEVLTSLLSRLFSAFDPIELAISESQLKNKPFQICLIEVIGKYKDFLSGTILQSTDRRTVKTPRKDAKDLKKAQSKSNAINKLWKNADSTSTLSSLLGEIRKLTQPDFSQNLRQAAEASGIGLVRLFNNRLCLSFKELIIDALKNLIGHFEEKDIPEIYISIILGEPITQTGNIRNTQTALSSLKTDDFRGVSALHIAALSGNIQVIEWLKRNKYLLNIQDNKGLYPFDYAVHYCLNNGIRLDLLESLCCEEILDIVQESVSGIVTSIEDRSLILSHLLHKFGEDVIQTYDGDLFIEAVTNGYSLLSESLGPLGDWSDDVYEAMLEMAPDVDDKLKEWAEEDGDIIPNIESELGEMELILFKNNLGYDLSPVSSDQEEDFEES
ncbi:MAG: ankyrin repeat domain-containing protein [Chlamydiia bacterium]|nr:ankyrin repeat domain-containing protein [Chlamydiia bacterium]